MDPFPTYRRFMDHNSSSTSPLATLELFVLGGLWGASFLFMRVAAPEFGAVPLIAVRVAIAALLLGSILRLRGVAIAWRRSLLPLTLVGAVNSALPFCLFAYATLSVNAGFAALLNATAPLFGALVGWIWLRERPARSRIAGLLVGFSGVVVLVWGKLSFAADGLAIWAGLAAALGYGIAAHATRRYLADLEPLAVAAGTQITAALLLIGPAFWLWPTEELSSRAWFAALAVGVFCTGLAYLLYFRLIQNLGPTRAITVAYLIPLFGMLWGFLFLAEAVTPRMVLGGAGILLGVALSSRR